MYSDLVKNRICRSGSGFHCFLCKVDIASKDEAYSHIVNDSKHLQELENVASLKNLKLDNKQCVDFINDGIIVINSKEYRCVFCLCDISVGANLKHVLEHVSGKKHINKRKKCVSDSAEDLVYSEVSSVQNLDKDVHNFLPEDCNNQEESTNDHAEDNPCGEKSKKSADDLLQDNPNPCSVQSNPDAAQNNKLSFSCNKCQDILQTNAALKYHRMFHLSPRNHISDIINFSIKDNCKQIHCLVCNCVMGSEDDLEKHLTDEVHQKRLVVLRCPNNNAIMNIMYINSALYPNIVIPSATNNIYNTLNEEFSRYLYYLQTCQAMIPRNPVNPKVFDCNLSVVLQQQDISQSNNLTSPSFFCFICNAKFLDENSLLLHYYYDYIHKFRMESIIFMFKDNSIKFVSFDNNEIIKCMKCQIEFTELNGVVIHLFDMKHLFDKPVECIQIGPDGRMLINNKNLYICPTCNIRVSTDAIMIQHLTSDYHKIKIQEYYTNINTETFKKVIFHCPNCKMNFFSDRSLLEHFYLQHHNGLKSNIPVSNVVHPSMYIMPNNTQFVPVSHVTNNPGVLQYYDVKNKNAYPVALNNLTYVQNNTVNTNNLNGNANHQQRNSFPLNDSNQNKKTTRDSAQIRNRNLINFSPRYVQLCIERGSENIFAINIEKIKNLELGISLTFPYKKNRCCIPCGCEVPNDVQLLYEHLRTEEHENNLQDMEDNDRYFENYRNQLSDLELSKAYMHEESDEWVNCYACDIQVDNCEVKLREHIDSEDHRLKHQSLKKSADDLIKLFYTIFENLWYYIEKFSCNLCCITFDFEIDYARHLEDIEHLKEVEKRLVKNESLKFDCCISCSSYWYSKSDYHKKHCSKESHLYILKTRDFTVPDMSNKVKQLLITAEETIDNLVKESDKSIVLGKEVENQLLRSVEQVVGPKYPEAKAYLFGSRISHLSFSNSDLDIYLDCENKYDTVKSQEEMEHQLAIAQDCFFRQNDHWKIEEIILRTRVPIIKLKHKSTNLNCDISFINCLSVEKSKILSYFVEAYLPCRKMILYLKKWCALCNLSGRKKGINSFALSWFVVFYLQVRGIFPSVQRLIEKENKSHLVTGWETGVSSNVEVKDTDASTVDLLRGFFKYYSEFNYISDVACPFLGKVMKKINFSEIDKLPKEMCFYKTQIKEEKIEFFRLDSPMCIQEPIDLSQNITKSVTKLQLRMFKQYCNESATILANRTD